MSSAARCEARGPVARLARVGSVRRLIRQPGHFDKWQTHLILRRSLARVAPRVAKIDHGQHADQKDLRVNNTDCQLYGTVRLGGILTHAMKGMKGERGLETIMARSTTALKRVSSGCSRSLNIVAMDDAWRSDVHKGRGQLGLDRHTAMISIPRLTAVLSPLAIARGVTHETKRVISLSADLDPVRLLCKP